MKTKWFQYNIDNDSHTGSSDDTDISSPTENSSDSANVIADDASSNDASSSDDSSSLDNDSSSTEDNSSIKDRQDDNSTNETSTATPVGIHYDVTLVAQPDDCTCWAASSSMVLSYWRDVDSSSSSTYYTVQEIKDMVTDAGPQYDTSCGLKPEDTQAVGDILGLSFDFPMCYGVDGFAAVLKDKGPIVFVRASVGGKGAHAIAVIGMNGDGTPDGTTVETLNPSPIGTGAQQNVSFSQLMRMMEQLGFWDQNDWLKSGGLDRIYIMYRK